MKDSGLDLTRGNLLRNLIKLSLPIMLSNFMQTFYNLTDTFWLGKLGEEARNAVSVAGLAFPLVFFISSFGFGFMIAGTSLTSQYKGANKPEKIKELVGQFLIILVLFSALFLTAGLLFLDKILKILNTPTVIMGDARQYISVILIGMVFMFIFFVYQSFSHGLGDTVSPMKIQIISVLTNVVLDPFFIFGVAFFPRLEILGAAYATLFARILAAVFSIIFMYRKTRHIIPAFHEIIPRKYLLKKIFSISIPASLAQSMTSFGFLILQGFVNSFGTVVISTYSIGNRLIGFFMMPAMGISNALASVIGQNLGADKKERAEKSVSVAMKLVMAIMTTGCLIMFFFGAYLTKFFIDDPAVIEAGKRMFRIVAVAANIFGIMFVFMGVFNGSGHTKPAMLVNISRLWFFRIPLTYMLSGYLLNFSFFQRDIFVAIISKLSAPLSEHPYDALWWAMLISNILASTWAYLIYRKGRWKKARIHSD